MRLLIHVGIKIQPGVWVPAIFNNLSELGCRATGSNTSFRVSNMQRPGKQTSVCVISGNVHVFM